MSKRKIAMFALATVIVVAPIFPRATTTTIAAVGPVPILTPQGDVESKAKAKAKDSIVSYTCSMHPEVTSNSPGECPKCLMVLTKKPRAKAKRP